MDTMTTNATARRMTDSEILAANAETVWDVLLIATEITRHGERTRFVASASYGAPKGKELVFIRAQAPYSLEATIYQRTKTGWRKRRA
jgi:hypothetical protein